MRNPEVGNFKDSHIHSESCMVLWQPRSIK
jgi:hypothetical protein